MIKVNLACSFVVDIYVRENSVEQKDSIFQLQPSMLKTKFISLEDNYTNKRKIRNDGVVILISFVKDQKTVSYQRTVLTFFDWCGLIGGINEILHLAGMLIVSSLSGKLFVFNLLSSLYQVSFINRKYGHADEYKMKALHENDTPIAKNMNAVTPKIKRALNKLDYINANSIINLELIKQSENEMK